MSVIKKIKKLNPELEIKSILAPSFFKYGKVIENFDCVDLKDYIKNHYFIPTKGVKYVPNIEELKDQEVTQNISTNFFGQMPIQVGYCAGFNDKLNGLEYHKSIELTIALTDLVIIVGSLVDVKDSRYETKKTEVFYVPKDTMFEFYSTTLHYVPCMVHNEGFQTVVILPYGTNFPLEDNNIETDKYLFMKNKWMLCHSENKKDIKQGCKVGLQGKNIKIFNE